MSDSEPSDSEYCKTQIFGNKYEVRYKYTYIQPLGFASGGILCSALHLLNNHIITSESRITPEVIIKQIQKPFLTPELAKRTYRELKLLKHFKHDNLITLLDIYLPPSEEIYFVTEYTTNLFWIFI